MGTRWAVSLGYRRGEEGKESGWKCGSEELCILLVKNGAVMK